MKPKSMRMAPSVGGAALLSLALMGCEAGEILSPGTPGAPRALEAHYHDQAVHVSWELPTQWDGEAFRVYSKRTSDQDYFLIAEVTSCAGGRCTYTDTNVVAGVTYEYYVAAVDPSTGDETATDIAIEVFVPEPVPPPAPDALEAVALDATVFLHWGRESREAEDFSHYRLYLENGDGSVFFLGETDSEGFLDFLVENGSTYGYFVTAVDDQGHESDGGALVEATPRPDFSGEILHAHEDRADASGFRFRDDETIDPIVPGDDPDRHFRLEVDANGWWLVPGPNVEVHPDATFTTALRCGPGADSGCTDVAVAPASGYSAADMQLVPEHSYVLRVPAGAGQWRYGVLRVTHVGAAQDGAFAVFDWAFQLQPGNRALSPPSEG